MVAAPTIPLEERIARGRRAIADGRGQGKDVSAFETRLHALLAEEALKALPAEEISTRLETLLLAIQAGARAGHAVRLPGVNPERVLSLIDVDWPSLDQEQAVALCRKAGPVTAMRLLVDDYLYYCHLLDERGLDTFIERAPLATALAHMPAEARAS